VKTRPTIQRGAALLTVLVAVAVLTAVAVDLSYSTRVSLQIAANSRDELRASWLARSGVSMSRLILSFQQQLDDAMPAMPATPKTGTMPAMPRIQIWNLVPVDSTLTQGLYGGAGGETKGAPAFEAKIEDEGRKANMQFDALAVTDPRLWLQVQSLYQLVCDARFDPLFEREDAHGVKTSRDDLLVHLRDWVDPNEQTSELVVDSGSGAPCGMVPHQPPFVDAFGDENQPYDRGEDRYRAKNARMDSLDELYLVAGVGDAFMQAFGDALTVYVPRDTKLNVNETDSRHLVERARMFAAPTTPVNPTLLDPKFAEQLHQAVMLNTFGGLLSYNSQQFAAWVQAAGVPVNQSLLASSDKIFTDRSTAFRIRASAQVGAVRSSIDAAVWLETPTPGSPTAAPGRLVHWREE
jgi:general secretion pathway protein K